MSKQLRELQARKATLVKDARALTDIAAAEERDMTDEELNAFNALKAKIEAASAAIDREAALIAQLLSSPHLRRLRAPVADNPWMHIGRHGRPVRGRLLRPLLALARLLQRAGPQAAPACPSCL